MYSQGGLWAWCLWGPEWKGAVRILPVFLPAGLTLLDVKEVCKVSFTRYIYAWGSVGFCGFYKKEISKISPESAYLQSKAWWEANEQREEEEMQKYVKSLGDDEAESDVGEVVEE